MNISTTISGRVATVRVAGRFEFSGHRDFRAAVEAALGSNGIGEVRIDLTAADYLDSSALGLLLLTREHAMAASKAVSLSVATGTVKQILDIANFQQLFSYR